MILHPMHWPDVIVAVMLAEGFLWLFRSTVHYVSRRRKQIQIAERVQQMRPGALDNYRAAQERGVRAPLG